MNEKPLEKLFKIFRENKKVEIWEHESTSIHPGIIEGFDEHMNVVMESNGSRFLLKGDCVGCVLELY